MPSPGNTTKLRQSCQRDGRDRAGHGVTFRAGGRRITAVRGRSARSARWGWVRLGQAPSAGRGLGEPAILDIGGQEAEQLASEGHHLLVVEPVLPQLTVDGLRKDAGRPCVALRCVADRHKRFIRSCTRKRRGHGLTPKLQACQPLVARLAAKIRCRSGPPTAGAPSAARSSGFWAPRFPRVRGRWRGFSATQISRCSRPGEIAECVTELVKAGEVRPVPTGGLVLSAAKAASPE